MNAFSAFLAATPLHVLIANYFFIVSALLIIIYLTSKLKRDKTLQ